MQETAEQKTARALIVQKAYDIIMDEPFSATEPYMKEVLRRNPDSILAQVIIRAGERIVGLEERVSALESKKRG
jgi:hypothetical protein